MKILLTILLLIFPTLAIATISPWMQKAIERDKNIKIQKTKEITDLRFVISEAQNKIDALQLKIDDAQKEQDSLSAALPDVQADEAGTNSEELGNAESESGQP